MPSDIHNPTRKSCKRGINTAVDSVACGLVLKKLSNGACVLPSKRLFRSGQGSAFANDRAQRRKGAEFQLHVLCVFAALPAASINTAIHSLAALYWKNCQTVTAFYRARGLSDRVRVLPLQKTARRDAKAQSFCCMSFASSRLCARLQSTLRFIRLRPCIGKICQTVTTFYRARGFSDRIRVLPLQKTARRDAKAQSFSCMSFASSRLCARLQSTL